MQRGKKPRPKQTGSSILLNHNPHPACLDLEDIHSDDFKGVPNLTPHPFHLRKQETESRIRILRERGRNWIPTRRKGRIIRDWVESITSSFQLTKEQLLQRSGFDDIVTLFLEYHWRRFVLGPGDALALVGLTLRHSLCRRTYSCRTKPPKKACRRSHTRRVVDAVKTGPFAVITEPGQDMMSHQPYGPVPDQGWPKREGQNPNKRPRSEVPSNFRRGQYPPPAKPHYPPSYFSATNTGFSQISQPMPKTGHSRTYRNATQQPHIAHTYNPPSYRSLSYSGPHHRQGQQPATPPPHPPERTVDATWKAKHQEVAPQYRRHGPGPPRPTDFRHPSHGHHLADPELLFFLSRHSRLGICADPPKPTIPIAELRREQEAIVNQKEQLRRQKVEDSEKERQEAEQILSQFSRMTMPVRTAPKSIADPTKNVSACNLPSFSKSTKKRKDRDEPQLLEQNAPPSCPPVAPVRLPPQSPPLEAATTPVGGSCSNTSSPSLDAITHMLGGSNGQGNAQDAVSEVAASFETQDFETSPTQDAHAIIEDVPPEPIRETRAIVEPVFEPQAVIGGTSEPPTRQEPRAAETVQGSSVSTESLGVRYNVPPRFRPSRNVFRGRQGVPEALDLEIRPAANQGEGSSEEFTSPQAPKADDIDRLPSSSAESHLPVTPTDAGLLGGSTSMEIDEDISLYPQIAITDVKPVLFPQLLQSKQIIPHDVSHPHQEPALDQASPPAPSTHPPPEPYRSLKELHTYPPIWAETRQEVCETFEWFRSYQGGVYFSHDIVRGYLLSAFGAKRDIFAHQGRLIISHGGGRAESIHKERGKCVLREAEDQRSDDKSVRALLKTYRDRRPIALVIDNRYAQFPYDLGSKGVTYAVLGFYMIVEAWAEVQFDPSSGRNIVKYKFAFQWCEGQGEPWWLSGSGKADIVNLSEATAPSKADEERPLRERRPTAVVMKACRHCGEESPQVYSQGWACLQPRCIRFWQLSHTAPRDPCIFLPDALTYHQGFLELREPCPLPIGVETLRPHPVKERADGITTSRYFTRGFHCDKCGRLSCRVEWQKWKCNTVGCDKAFIVKAKVRDAKEFWSQPITTRYLTVELDPSSGVKRLPPRSLLDDGGNLVGLVDTFVLPEQRGFLHHIQPPGPHSRLEANNIFKKYQEQANDGSLVFKRWPMRAHKCRGALLTNYFSHNAGEPYHYVGGTDNTVPFDKAPGAVIDARALIQRRISQALGRAAEFNEVLTAAYMEKQKMAFHSDEEVGLGPLVAGLSLGSPAFMHFRLQRKHDKSGERQGILMSFILRHGDVFVMDGTGVQKYYEHTVVPTNFRIAATARMIDAKKNAPLTHTRVKDEPPLEPVIPPLELMSGGLTMAELASQLDT